MSIEHTPPSTYILRELHDVAIPDSVSWMPQTIGWKIVGMALALIGLYVGYRLALSWWHNRYRKEALRALMLLDARDKNSAEQAFKIIKVVIRYLDSRNANLFGQAYLERLNSYCPNSPKTAKLFNDDLASLWMQSLINPRLTLTLDQRLEVIQKSISWLKRHKRPALANEVQSIEVKTKAMQFKVVNTKRGESNDV
ncbi:DUF4381 domain-containing protein [Vibrio sp. VB16]|uniref:DUF4381 domain-containing protein n=1 Tax=Vibrio sp. VB16 TaxID=2785746 RepID=UPI0018A064A1|nr:DUF4381 domain-containing protein [Vibrio sp. VB16]UGA57519.1 DUF4381 domain-containing protein [Vibrio sp. VB16]